MRDPLQEAVRAKRASKRRARRREEQAEQPPEAPLIAEGARSAMPPLRPGFTPDELLREAVAEMRGKPRWTRVGS